MAWKYKTFAIFLNGAMLRECWPCKAVSAQQWWFAPNTPVVFSYHVKASQFAQKAFLSLLFMGLFLVRINIYKNFKVHFNEYMPSTLQSARRPEQSWHWSHGACVCTVSQVSCRGCCSGQETGEFAGQAGCLLPSA